MYTLLNCIWLFCSQIFIFIIFIFIVFANCMLTYSISDSHLLYFRLRCYIIFICDLFFCSFQDQTNFFNLAFKEKKIFKYFLLLLVTWYHKRNQYHFLSLSFDFDFAVIALFSFLLYKNDKNKSEKKIKKQKIISSSSVERRELILYFLLYFVFMVPIYFFNIY